MKWSRLIVPVALDVRRARTAPAVLFGTILVRQRLTASTVAPGHSLAPARALLSPMRAIGPFVRAAASTLAPLPLATLRAAVFPGAIHCLQLFFREWSIQFLLQRVER